MKKTEKQATAKDVVRIVEAVKQLTGHGILRIEKGVCKASFFPEVWKDRNARFKTEWCGNILTYWCIDHGVIDRYSKTLELYSLDLDGAKIGTFTLKGGFVAVEVAA